MADQFRLGQAARRQPSLWARFKRWSPLHPGAIRKHVRKSTLEGWSLGTATERPIVATVSLAVEGVRRWGQRRYSSAWNPAMRMTLSAVLRK